MVCSAHYSDIGTIDMRKVDLWHALLLTTAIVFALLMMLASLVHWSDGPTYFWVEFANLASRNAVLLLLVIFPIVFVVLLGWHKLTGR